MRKEQRKKDTINLLLGRKHQLETLSDHSHAFLDELQLRRNNQQSSVDG
jgi:hypothetical protein